MTKKKTATQTRPVGDDVSELVPRVEAVETLPDTVWELRQEVMGLAEELAAHLETCTGTTQEQRDRVAACAGRLMEENAR